MTCSSTKESKKVCCIRFNAIIYAVAHSLTRTFSDEQVIVLFRTLLHTFFSELICIPNDFILLFRLHCKEISTSPTILDFFLLINKVLKNCKSILKFIIQALKRTFRLASTNKKKKKTILLTQILS